MLVCASHRFYVQHMSSCAQAFAESKNARPWDFSPHRYIEHIERTRSLSLLLLICASQRFFATKGTENTKNKTSWCPHMSVPGVFSPQRPEGHKESQLFTLCSLCLCGECVRPRDFPCRLCRFIHNIVNFACYTRLVIWSHRSTGFAELHLWLKLFRLLRRLADDCHLRIYHAWSSVVDLHPYLIHTGCFIKIS